MVMPLIAAMLAAAAAAPVPLVPTTPWASFEEGHRCTVERTFGPKPAGTFGLKLGYSPLGYVLGGDFIVRTSTRPGSANDITITLDDRPAETFASRMLFLPKAGVALFRVERMSDEFWRAFRASRRIRIAAGGVIAAASYTAADKVADAAERCAEHRYEAWGGNLKLRATGTQPIMKDARWSQVGDYPKEALDHGATGKVFMYYTVMPDGRVGDCKVALSSHNKALDRESCARLVKRAQFTPGTDAGGTPVPWVEGMWFRWAIGDGDLADDLYLGSFIGAGQGGGNVN